MKTVADIREALARLKAVLALGADGWPAVVRKAEDHLMETIHQATIGQHSGCFFRPRPPRGRELVDYALWVIKQGEAGRFPEGKAVRTR